MTGAVVLLPMLAGLAVAVGLVERRDELKKCEACGDYKARLFLVTIRTGAQRWLCHSCKWRWSR